MAHLVTWFNSLPVPVVQFSTFNIVTVVADYCYVEMCDVHSAGGTQQRFSDAPPPPAAAAAASGAVMSMNGAVCSRCRKGFTKDEEIVNSGGEIWHTQCFV